jgi:hypothetical protein
MSVNYYKGRPTRVPPKDPDAEITYGFDWTDYLQGKTILSSEWSATGITVESSSFTNNATAAVLSGGERGRNYNVTNRITFTGATGTETDDRTLVVPVRDL